MTERKTALRTTKAKVEGTKNEIVACQAEHEMMTGIVKRMKTFCDTREGHYT